MKPSIGERRKASPHFIHSCGQIFELLSKNLLLPSTSFLDDAPGHTLSKESICAALWPKKEHPENTLYTFISRLKVTLKDQSDLDIINKRGREYQLVKNSQKTDSQHHSP